ncbi:bifunctional lysylphosphatidylglycerol flippase/synthetase MprF [Agreia sp. Leaf210]|uniref:bifunctional lysylphosphatidylglycerol flippase/synthetase MprF n=1 Tax=Agreia sp. Leaf210 TaxID=1735682 RepID=UPI000701D00B|nr:DUF2156 domain-containing protein [Agreia sp. Leaf210]KQM60598.1 hypothetical protein ASE64_02660 [Agreia sp. Leaf210]
MSSTLGFIAQYLRTVPLSVGFAALLIITSIVTGTIGDFVYSDPAEETWGAGVATASNGQWWTFVTALVIPGDPAQLVAGVLLSLVLLGTAERAMGARRVIASFLVTGVLGLVVGVFFQWIGSLAGEWWAAGTSLDLTLDPLTPIVGSLLTASAFLSALWRRRVRIVTFSILLMFVLYDGDSSNSYRLSAAVLGLVLGRLLARRGEPVAPQRSSHAEVRVLLATIVAVTAVGPVIALINPDGFGPFAAASELFRTFPDAASTTAECAGATSASCVHQLALLSLAGPGPLLLTFIPLVLLLVAAWGLRKGRRFALWLAVLVNIAFALLAWFSLDVMQTLQTEGAGGPSLDVVDYVVWLGSAVVVPIVISAVLVARRAHFGIRAPREALIRFTLVSLVSLVALSVLYLIVGWLTLGSYVPDATLSQLTADVFRRFIPVNFLGTTGHVMVPRDELTRAVFHWVGPLFWAIMVAGILRVFAATDQTVRVGDPQRFRALLKRGGGGTMGWMGTWPGNVYWFSADGEAAVAYRVINDIAITMSDPVCRDDRATQTIREFADFCDANSWTPVFYSVHPQYLRSFDDLGWQYMSVGEETLMHPVTLDMAGKPWQKVRQALNRGIKEGVTTQWLSYDELTLSQANQINAISEAWVSEKELPEMGFTLGALEEIKDSDVKLMLALDPEGMIQAVTSWLPIYRDGVPVGYTIDFMRRADGSMNGTMEFLIASAALAMQKDGIEVLSLSGAPLASKPLAAGEEPPAPTVLTGLLEFLAKTLEPAYGFSTLFRFKAKFNPTYETIYMAYADPLELPAIGAAVGKAYLPTVSAKEAVSLVRTLAAKK